jgi:transformation/transcription domain-associated protein
VTEIRDMIDAVREFPEFNRMFPLLVQTLLEILQSGEPSFRKDAQEFVFRRTALEILNRLPPQESIKPKARDTVLCMLHLLRHDNEDNGVTCCKIVVDVVRNWKCLDEELSNQLASILYEVLGNMETVVALLLSENAATQDQTISQPSLKSFKVLAEMGLIMSVFHSSHRNLLAPITVQVNAAVFKFLSLEAPAQKKAREDCEAMGNFWSGMSSTICNPSAYSEFIGAQIKV